MEEIPSILERLEFELTRQSRAMIQDFPAREHLLRVPPPEETCPVRQLLFRRAGIRLATVRE